MIGPDTRNYKKHVVFNYRLQIDKERAPTRVPTSLKIKATANKCYKYNKYQIHKSVTDHF